MNKHIAFFASSLIVGGVERAFVNLANGFVRNGYSVDFVVNKNVGDLIEELDERVKLISLDAFKLRNSFFKLRGYILSSKAEYLISGPTYPNVVALLANFLAYNKAKLIISQHSYQDIEMEDLGFLGRIAPTLIKRLYNSAHRVVCVSEGVAKDMINNYNVNPDKVSVIYNSVIDDTFFAKSNHVVDQDLQELIYGKKYIISVGRLVKVKNHAFMIKAFAKLKSINPSFDYNLIILGEGEERLTLQSLIEELSVSDHIHLLGAFANPLPILKGAKLFIHSSFSEAMPLVYVEALALKVPVVTIVNSGADEILKGLTPKIIIDEFDEDQFIAAIVKSLNVDYSNDDFPSLEKFSSEQIMREFLEIMQHG